MPAPEPIAGLIPHQGRMCLLERVLDWDAERIRLATTTHRAADHPLRRGSRLRAVHLCEYGAQAMAVHGGLCARAAGGVARPGLLVSLRAVTFTIDEVQNLDGELIVEAERLLEAADSWQYRFRVLHGERVLAEGRAAVMVRSA